MSKRSVFTTITPLPAHISREAVIKFLHDYEEMIDLNPLVKERHPIRPPIDADPDEEKCIWYSLTDKITYLPGGLATSDISYTCVFRNLPDGLQTHCRASMGVDIQDRWSVGGSLPGEPPAPAEAGVDIPKYGLYLREDCDLRCHLLMLGFVKKTLKKSHATLVERLAAKALLIGSTDRGRALSSQLSVYSASLQPGSHHTRGHQRSVSQPPLTGAYVSGLGIAHPYGGEVTKPQQQQRRLSPQPHRRLSPQPAHSLGEHIGHAPVHHPERRSTPPLQGYRAEVVPNSVYNNPFPAPLRLSRGPAKSVTPPFPSPAWSATSQSGSIWRPSGQSIQSNPSVSSRQSVQSTWSNASGQSMTSSVTSSESHGARYGTQSHDAQPAKTAGQAGGYAAHPDYPVMNPYADDPRSALSTDKLPTFTELVGEPFPNKPKEELGVSATLNGPWVDDMMIY